VRVENWNPNKMDETFENVAIERLVEGAEIVANRARSKVRVGTLSRPIYKTGPKAGKEYTSREAGRLKKSIRVTRLKTKSGKAFSKKRNVRIYAGKKDTDYHFVIEFRYPFLRTSLYSSISEIRSVIGAK